MTMDTEYDEEQRITVDGLIYDRDNNDQHYRLRKTAYNDLIKQHVNQEIGDKPQVRCECNSEQFTLRYRTYEIIARCIKCGKEDSVYSG